MAGGGRFKSILKKVQIPLESGTQGYFREPRGPRNVEVLVNPNQQEVERWAGREITDLRMMIDIEGNSYVWDGYESIHMPIIEGLGIPKNSTVDELADVPVHPKNYSYHLAEHAENVATYNHLEGAAPPKVQVDPEIEFNENIPRDAIDQETDFGAGGAVKRAMTKRWRIWDTKEKQFVGQPYKNKKRARTRMDNLDNEYGAYRYQVREVEKKAGGGRIKKGLSELKKGPGLHEAAKEAIRQGDAQEAVRLLKELQELLQLDDEQFGMMIASEIAPPRPPAKVYSPNDPIGSGGRHPLERPRVPEKNPLRLQELLSEEETVPTPGEARSRRYEDILEQLRENQKLLEETGERRAPDSPLRKAGGGPIKGALIQAQEAFARKAGKRLNEGLDIPQGFASFYTRAHRNHTEIIGVRQDGTEQNVGNIGGAEGHEDMAKQIAGAYTTGGFSDLPIQQVPMEELFGRAEGPPKADVDKRLLEMLRRGDLPLEEGEIGVKEQYMPGGVKVNRLRSFQDHLENLMTHGDPDEFELADLATIAEDSLSEADYETLMGQLYDAGLTPQFYRDFAENVKKGDMDYEPDVTVTVGPQSLKDILGIVGDDPGQFDVHEVLRMLREGTEGIPDDASEQWIKLRDDVAALTPEELQDQLMEIMRKQGQTPIDLRRLTFEELSTLQEQKLVPADVAEELMENMSDLESEFQDIIYDITGDYPDELRIMPDLDNAEHYIIESFSQDTGTRRYHAFDPETGPREATRAEIDSFNTERDVVLTPQKRRPPEGETIAEAATRLGKKPKYAGQEFDDLSFIHEEIANELDEVFADEYSLDVYIDEYDLHPDPNQEGAYFAKGVVVKEIDTNETVGAQRNFHIDEKGVLTETFDDPPKKFQEGGSVKDDVENLRSVATAEKGTSKRFMQNVFASLFGAIPFAGKEAQLVGVDVGSRVHQLGAAPIAGFKSQWWGVNPTTDEFEYAGPMGEMFRNPYPDPVVGMHDMEEYERQLRAWEERAQQTHAIPGIIDETMLLPAMPQMIEMMTDMDEIEANPYAYEPSIGAPDFSLHATERAEENWNRSIESMGMDEPEGFVENTLMSLGMMVGQVPIPIAALGRIKSLARMLMPKGARAAHILDDLLKQAHPDGRLRRMGMGALESGPEFFFPTIEPKVSNYIAGALFGGTLLTALSPEEQEEIPTGYRELISIMQDESQPIEDRELARTQLQTILQAEEMKKQEADQQKESNRRLLDQIGKSGAFAGGGKIRKFSRRDILKGLGAGTAAAGAGALGMGKAATKTGLPLEPAAALKEIEAALDVPPAAAKVGNPKRGIEVLREVAARLDELQADSLKEADDIMKGGHLGDQDLVDDATEMAEMFGEDARDFATVADHMEKGEYELAAETYDSLDTVAREEIYEYLPVEDVDEARAALAQAGSDWESIPMQFHPDYDKVRQVYSTLDHTSSPDNIRLAFELEEDLISQGYDADEFTKQLRRIRNRIPREEFSRMRKGLPYSRGADQYSWAGGGKVKKGLTRRDVLKGGLGAGAAALGLGKAGVRAGVDDPSAAIPAIKEALEPASVATKPVTSIFRLDQLSENARKSVERWLDMYIENASEYDPEMMADAATQRELMSWDRINDDLKTDWLDSVMDRETEHNLENLLDMAVDDSAEIHGFSDELDFDDHAGLKEALEKLRAGKSLDIEEFFDQLATDAMDRPSAFFEYQHRIGIPEEDWIELPMRGELSDQLTGKQLKEIGKLFPGGTIPERLESGHWDT